MGPGSHDDMLEVAVWIGVVVVGLAVLAFLEVLRSNSFIGAHRGEIWMALPTVVLCALASIAGAGAVLFFFRFFLGDVWQYALPVAIYTFVLLVWRIWQQQSEERSAARPEPWSGSRLKPIFTLATPGGRGGGGPGADDPGAGRGIPDRFLPGPHVARCCLALSSAGPGRHIRCWPLPAPAAHRRAGPSQRFRVGLLTPARHTQSTTEDA